MLFDPFTMIAQLVNFAVLVLALRYFLYGRVIAAMDEREEKIAARLSDAAEREAEAEAAGESYRCRERELDQRSEELLGAAERSAAERRSELVDQARRDVEDQRQRWLQGLRRERDDLERELRRRVGTEVLELGRRALGDLADADLERRALDKALDQLGSDESARTALFGAPDDPERPAVIQVRLGFAAQVDRDHLSARLRELGMGEDQAVEIEHAPDAVLGVELRTDGTAVAWNVDDYLDRLGAMIDELVDQGGGDGSGGDRQAPVG